MDKSLGVIFDYKSDELKKRLLECLDAEARQFSDIARQYFDRGQLSKEDKTGLLRAVITAIDHVMAAGGWNNSLFLRNTLKPLITIKVEAETELEKLEFKAAKKTIHAQPLASDEKEIYVSLFQSDGYNIGKWAMQLRSLDRYTIGRPVYETETDVETRIRLRPTPMNEAYVVVAVKKSDVQPPAFQASLKDPFGHTLLQLKETAVRDGRINAFVHHGMRYRFVDGQLIQG